MINVLAYQTIFVNYSKKSFNRFVSRSLFSFWVSIKLYWIKKTWRRCYKYFSGCNLPNGKEATVNRTLDGNTYPGEKLVHSVFGKINYGGLKHNSLYLGLVLPSGG
jgi:hypothetical protein